MMQHENVRSVLKRTTFLVADAERAAWFYEQVFGWSRWYDNCLPVRAGIPPAAPDGAPAKLTMLRARDSAIGMLAFMQYVEPPFDIGTLSGRTRVRNGEAMLVIETEEIDAVHERAREAGASIVVQPTEWEVPAPGSGSSLRLRTMTLFDPNGIFLEVFCRLPAQQSPA